ncbi:hypothetical protein BH09BAC3_BH09BAC3_22050 [soil metagenome]
MIDLRQYIPKSIKKLYKGITMAPKRKYLVGNYEIDLPANFSLPEYQKKFKLYDRFLPVLVHEFSSGSTIIDIGANIGDTAIAMLATCKSKIVCVEPSDIFFPYLQKNLSYLTVEDKERVTTIKAFIGTGEISGTLDHFESTASIKVDRNVNTVSYVPLDNLTAGIQDVILIKTDTDGFDFDVIKSAIKTLGSSEPILFWENEISEDFQLKGFTELYSLLTQNSYNHIYIFDNFGNLISEETNFDSLKNINDYIYSMKKNNTARTIYYTDIMASTKKNHQAVNSAINRYREEWIKK